MLKTTKPGTSLADVVEGPGDDRERAGEVTAGFDVVSDQHWIAGRRVRGYRRTAFDDVFPRYLSSEPGSRANPNESRA